jgi:F-type H+-transporting ATPase subunit b
MHIDLWTLGLQAINAGVLIWLLARFLFRPVQAVIGQRQAAADALLAQAAAARTQAEADAAAIAAQRLAFAARSEAMVAEAQVRAAEAAAAERTQAEQAIATLRAAATTDLARERSAMQAALTADAAALAVSIARRLLDRVPEPVVTQALLDDLARRLAALPAEERTRLAGTDIQLVTPAVLPPDRQALAAAALAQALGMPADRLHLRFLADPALLAGAELRAPHTLIRNHWQADLDRIAQELRPDTPHDARPAPVA